MGIIVSELPMPHVLEVGCCRTVFWLQKWFCASDFWIFRGRFWREHMQAKRVDRCDLYEDNQWHPSHCTHDGSVRLLSSAAPFQRLTIGAESGAQSAPMGKGNMKFRVKHPAVHDMMTTCALPTCTRTASFGEHTVSMVMNKHGQTESQASHAVTSYLQYPNSISPHRCQQLQLLQLQLPGKRCRHGNRDGEHRQLPFHSSHF